jgi:hypothetical protein
MTMHDACATEPSFENEARTAPSKYHEAASAGNTDDALCRAALELAPPVRGVGGGGPTSCDSGAPGLMSK